MLSLILGRSGSGKTTLLRQKMAEALKAGKKVCLLVPEQFSFENERNLAESLAGPDFFRLQVLSFTRLSTFLLEAKGGVPPRFLDAGGKILLAAKAGDGMQDRLQVYQSAISSPGFIKSLLSFFDEASACAIAPEDLSTAAETLPENARLRIQDLSALFAAYQSLIETGPLDPAGCILRAAEAAREVDFLAEYEWFIDGFDRFSAAQLKLLACMLTQAEQVTISLTLDPYEANSEFGLFAQNQDTLQKVLNLARSLHVEVASPIKLSQNYRAASEALRALEAGFLAEEELPGVPCEGKVQVIACPSVYQEAETVCAMILDLVRSQNYRYRDFVVITRSLENNADLFSRVFEKYGIPYFLDRREPVADKPLAVCISALLEILCYGFSGENLLRYAKSGALGLSTEELSALENYCYIWRIDYNRWKEPFLFPPGGPQGEMNEDERAELAKLEETRKKIVDPLLHLQNRIHATDGKGFAKALWQFLCEIRCQEHFDAAARLLPEPYATQSLEEGHKTHEAIVALLEQFVAYYGETPMDASLFARLFRLQVSTYSLGQVPNTLDNVLIGSADRIRTDNRKVCLITGFVSGAWPFESAAADLITPMDRRALLAQDIYFGGLEEDMAARENFLAYTALSSVSDRLIITVPTADRSYSPLLPSRYLKSIFDIYEDLIPQRSDALPPELFVCNEQTLLAKTADALGDADATEAAFRAVLGERKPAALSLLAKASLPKEWKMTDPEAISGVFGHHMHLSASKVETYHRCRFSYFVKYALKLKERRRAEFAPLETGGLIHWVLEQAIRTYDPKEMCNLPEEGLRAFCKEKVYQYVAENFLNPDDLSPRQKSQLTRIATTLSFMLIRLAEEFAVSEFQPVDTELAIGGEEGLPAYQLTTPLGNRVSVVGKIDRVDLCEKNGQRYIRIADYKTGRKKFLLQSVYYGLDLQMLIYLFAVWKNGGQRYGSVLPAGILYFPARTEWEQGEDKNESPRHEFKMEGLVLNDPDVLNAMDPEKTGLYIPCIKQGKHKDETLATLSQLGELRMHVESMLCKMADELTDGRIEACPKVKDKESPCDYCPYKGICQNEEADQADHMEDLDKAEFYALISEEHPAEQKEVADPCR